MICYLAKWFVSNAADKKKTVPKFVQNHLKRCRSCRKFDQLTRDLELNAAAEAQSIMQRIPATFLEKVKSQPAKMTVKESLVKPKRKMIPILSLSASLAAVVLLTVFVLLPPARTPSAPLNETLTSLFSRDSLPGGALQNLASQVNTPFREEWIQLSKAVRSASRYLTSQLDLQIEPPLYP